MFFLLCTCVIVVVFACTVLPCIPASRYVKQQKTCFAHWPSHITDISKTTAILVVMRGLTYTLAKTAVKWDSRYVRQVSHTGQNERVVCEFDPHSVGRQERYHCTFVIVSLWCFCAISIFHLICALMICHCLYHNTILVALDKLITM